MRPVRTIVMNREKAVDKIIKAANCLFIIVGAILMIKGLVFGLNTEFISGSIIAVIEAMMIK